MEWKHIVVLVIGSLWDKPAHLVDIKYSICVDEENIHFSALIIYTQGVGLSHLLKDEKINDISGVNVDLLGES